MDRKKERSGYFFIPPNEPVGNANEQLYYEDPARFKTFNDAEESKERKIIL